MPPKKRRASVAKVNGKAKKPNTTAKAPSTCPHSGQSSTNIKVQQTQNSNGTATLRNAQDSALLCLPAELRERIWEMAFGGMTYHPVSDRRYTQRERIGKIQFKPCSENLSEYDIYNLSLEGSKKDNEYEWASIPETTKEDTALESNNGVKYPGTHESSQCHRYGSGVYYQTLVPLVCKQLYYEALPIAWKTSRVCFFDSVSFIDFVHLPAAKLDLIPAMTIILDQRGMKNGWKAVLAAPTIARFKSLRSLSLVIRSNRWFWDIYTTPGVRKLNSMKFMPGEYEFLPSLVKAFRQLPLKEESTTVWVCNQWFKRPGMNEQVPPFYFKVSEMREVAEEIKSLLMKHEPQSQRTSRSRR